MSMREALEAAMHSGSAEGAASALAGQGYVVAGEDTMTQAIHDVYCGIMADHDHPNEKDAEQARTLLAALRRQGA